MTTTFHFKDEIQAYLESECIIQQETKRLINTKLKNFKSCNAFSIKSVKFKKYIFI